MYSVHSAMAHEVAKVQLVQMLREAERARLSASAGSSGAMSGVRRALGAALVAVGEWVHGDVVAARVHETEARPAAAELRLAR